MKVYKMTFEQSIPISLEEAWHFFSSPHNLAAITPSEMGFAITSGQKPDEKMYPGILISYKIKPVGGISLDWTTEITHIKEKVYFIDEQRFGPYKIWHHEHWFSEVPGGVFMKDLLLYALPMGFIGEIMNRIMVEKKILEIFNYRRGKIEELFGKH